MKRRGKKERCRICGYSVWVEAVDNAGKKYIGCAHCSVSLKPPEKPGWEEGKR